MHVERASWGTHLHMAIRPASDPDDGPSPPQIEVDRKCNKDDAGECAVDEWTPDVAAGELPSDPGDDERRHGDLPDGTVNAERVTRDKILLNSFH